jgi:hypothetical protein
MIADRRVASGRVSASAAASATRPPIRRRGIRNEIRLASCGPARAGCTPADSMLISSRLAQSSPFVMGRAERAQLISSPRPQSEHHRKRSILTSGAGGRGRGLTQRPRTIDTRRRRAESDARDRSTARHSLRSRTQTHRSRSGLSAGAGVWDDRQPATALHPRITPCKCTPPSRLDTHGAHARQLVDLRAHHSRTLTSAPQTIVSDRRLDLPGHAGSLLAARRPPPPRRAGRRRLAQLANEHVPRAAHGLGHLASFCSSTRRLR